MTSGRDIDHEALSTPPLPPELWNFAVVVTICVLMSWFVRLTQIFLTLADVRYAINSDAVLYLKDLGVSLNVLQSASLWHFQQLLRTNMEVASSKMKSVQIPFDLVSSSIEIKRAAVGSEPSPKVSTSPPSSVLAFRVRSTVPITVQVLWSVSTTALDASFPLPSTAPAPRESGQQLLPPIMRRISMDRTVRALRTAPTRLSRLHRQRRRHELEDENATDGGASDHHAIASGTPPVFTADDFVSHSEMLSCGLSATSEDVVVVPIPPSAAVCPQDELQSLIDEVDSHSPGSVVSPPPTANAPSPPAPRFSAVIVIRTISASPVRSAGLFTKLGTRRPSVSPETKSSAVVCQCIALDFLPTPLKPERFNPAIVKKISYTESNAYVSQEIYGRDVAAGGECTICLEGVLSVVLLPCRHFCVCRVCLEEIDRCPICRAKFSTYICYDTNECGDDSQASTLQVKVA